MGSGWGWRWPVLLQAAFSCSPGAGPVAWGVPPLAEVPAMPWWERQDTGGTLEMAEVELVAGGGQAGGLHSPGTPLQPCSCSSLVCVEGNAKLPHGREEGIC